MRARITADRTGARLPLREIFAPLLDDLATAYAEDPHTLGRLLVHHAGAVASLDHAVTDEQATDYGRAMRAAEVDAARDALLDELPAGDRLDDVLDARAALRLADDLTSIAARIYQNRTSA